MICSKYATVNGSKIHYLEEGKGDQILFLHGVPTSSHLWRNIIPVLAKHGRCIAPDLIGMGKSDKPNIEYTLEDHINYIEQFIDKLNLNNITIVTHGLGSAIGFHYAMHHEERVKAIAFYEAHVRPVTTWDMLSLPIQSFLHTICDNIVDGYKKIVEDNFLLDKLLPASTLCKLSNDDLKEYQRPFVESKHRKPLWQYMQDFSFGKTHDKTVELVTEYSEKLKKSSMPKLMLFSTPGFMTTMDTINWCREHLDNLSIVDLDEGLHLAQESNPKMFASILDDWYASLESMPSSST